MPSGRQPQPRGPSMLLLPAHASRRHAACIERAREGEGEGGRQRVREREGARERVAAWASLYVSYRVLDSHTASRVPGA
jgi:hypothetical protein